MSFKNPLRGLKLTLYPVGGRERYRKRAKLKQTTLPPELEVNGMSTKLWVNGRMHIVDGEVRELVDSLKDRISKLELEKYALQKEKDWDAQQMKTLKDKCTDCKALESAAEYVRFLENSLEVTKLAAKKVEDERDKREGEFLDTMASYIGLGNVVTGFVDMMPDHVLYDSVRQDVKDYLYQIERKELED